MCLPHSCHKSTLPEPCSSKQTSLYHHAAYAGHGLVVPGMTSEDIQELLDSGFSPEDLTPQALASQVSLFADAQQQQQQNQQQQQQGGSGKQTWAQKVGYKHADPPAPKHVQQNFVLVHRRSAEALAYPDPFKVAKHCKWDYIVQVPGMKRCESVSYTPYSCLYMLWLSTANRRHCASARCNAM